MQPPLRRAAVACVLLTCAVVATACSGGQGRDPRSTAPLSSAAPTATAPTAAAWRAFTGPLQRCGPQPPGVLATPYRPLTLRDSSVGRIPAVRLGDGKVVVVLLHQTDGNGFCGWLPFMPAAAEAGLSVLAIDLCSYGEAECRKVDDGSFSDADQTDPVSLAVRYAHTRLHASRVIVVGASMGGSVALMSAATLAGIDAAVDLSGPVEWRGMDRVRRGRALDVPTLVAMAASEGRAEVAGAEEIVANASAGSALLTPEAGHGYVLLTDDEGTVLPLGREVLRWITSRSGSAYTRAAVRTGTAARATPATGAQPGQPAGERSAPQPSSVHSFAAASRRANRATTGS